MPTEVIMPKVDMDMAVGKIAAWHIQEGQAVEKGAPLFDIETDKAAMEVESPASGTLRHVSAETGVNIPIGETIAWIYAEGEPDAPPPDREAAANVDPDTSSAKASAPVEQVAKAAPATQSFSRLRATPAARRAAREIGVDLNAVAGSGPLGRIQAADVAVSRSAAPQVGLDAALPPPCGWTPEAGPLFVLETGAGDATPVFMIHGFAADGYSWAALEPHLPTGRRVVKLELPGHGRSPKRHVQSFSALNRMVVEAFDEMGLERAHVVGHSLGGALALGLADIRPRSVASLTLIAPGGLGPEIDGGAIAGLARASRAESLGPWLRRLTAAPDVLDDAFVAAAMAARSKPDLRAAQLDMSRCLFPDGTQSFDLRAALQRLKVPTALLWGKRDMVLPWAQALAAPGCVALHLMENVGHLAHLEAPELVGAIIARHIRASEMVHGLRGA